MKLTMKTQKQLYDEGWKTSLSGPFGYYYTGEARNPQNKINAYDIRELNGKTCEVTKVHLDATNPYVEVIYGSRKTKLPWCAFKEHISSTNPDLLFEKYRKDNMEINYYKKFEIFDFDWGISGQKSPKVTLRLVTWLASKLGYKLVKVKKG